MGYKIFLPILKDKDKTTHDTIVTILSQEFPLSLKQIYYIAQTQYNNMTTYQAFHKSAKQLVENNIIIKINNKYELNIDWIKDIEDFAHKIRNTYTNSDGDLIKEIDDVKVEGPITELTFNNLGDLDKYFVILNKNYLSQLDIDEFVCGELRHTWWPILNSREEYDNVKNYKNYSNTRYICKGNSEIDYWVSNYYNKIGVLNKYDVDCAKHYDMWIYGDNIVQTILPNELNQKIDKYFVEPKSFTEFDTEGFLKEVFDTPFKVKVIINKNPFMAEHLKKQILLYFE